MQFQNYISEKLVFAQNKNVFHQKSTKTKTSARRESIFYFPNVPISNEHASWLELALAVKLPPDGRKYRF